MSCSAHKAGATTGYPGVVQQQVFQSPTQGGGPPMKQAPTQHSPVQQSPIQSGPPQKTTRGGGPSVQYVPVQVTPQKLVLIPRPQPRIEVEERRRHRGGGGGGGTHTEHKRPESRIQAQQNHGGSIVNRESRNMPANYRDRVTSDRGKHGRTHQTSDPGGAKRGQVSAHHNGGSSKKDNDRDHGTSPSGHKKTAKGAKKSDKD